MTTTNGSGGGTPDHILSEACRIAGMDPVGVVLLRHGENTIYRLADTTIVRVARPGQQDAAAREVAISRWLNHSGVPAVTALDDVTQPVVVEDRAVTFWQHLPPYTPATPQQAADVLKALHALPVPEVVEVPLTRLDPFVRLADRINGADIPTDDRDWLLDHLSTLMEQWAHVAPTLPVVVVHGDAWAGNLAAMSDGRVVLLDLERCSIGPVEWDLTSTAVRWDTYAGITRQQYDTFADSYGRDVTGWEHYRLFRDIRELRMTTYMTQHTHHKGPARHEAMLRIACLKGERGPRPWPWTPATG